MLPFINTTKEVNGYVSFTFTEAPYTAVTSFLPPVYFLNLQAPRTKGPGACAKWRHKDIALLVSLGKSTVLPSANRHRNSHTHTQHMTANFNESKENVITEGDQMSQAPQIKMLPEY